MKTLEKCKRQFGVIAGAGAILAALLAACTPSLTIAQNSAVQESPQTTNGRDEESDSKPMCPMMAGLKGIKLTADSPPLLMARADELKLTEQQKQQLKSIAQEAQRKAANVLTADQKSMLGESPEKAMGMMEIAMMRSKDMRDDKSGMCPMCKKKMEGTMKMMKDKERGGEDSTSN